MNASKAEDFVGGMLDVWKETRFLLFLFLYPPFSLFLTLPLSSFAAIRLHVVKFLEMVALRENQKNSDSLVEILTSHLPSASSTSTYQVFLPFPLSFFDCSSYPLSLPPLSSQKKTFLPPLLPPSSSQMSTVVAIIQSLHMIAKRKHHHISLILRSLEGFHLRMRVGGDCRFGRGRGLIIFYYISISLFYA